MSHDIIVPVDLTEEEKAVLAILSLRQFYITFPTLIVCSAFLVFGGLPFIEGWVEVLIRIFIWILGMGIALALAFVKLEKYDQYLSDYVITKISYWKSQKLYYP